MKNCVTISSSTVAVVVLRLWVGVVGEIVKEKESFFSAMESSQIERGLAVNVAHTQQRSLSGSNVLAHFHAPHGSREVQGRVFSLVLNSQCLFRLTLFLLGADKLHQLSHEVALAVGDGDVQCSVTGPGYSGRVSLLVLLVRSHHFPPLTSHAQFEQTLVCFFCVLARSTIFPFSHHHVIFPTTSSVHLYMCVRNVGGCYFFFFSFLAFISSYSNRK